MIAQRMVEYSFSVPADGTASVSLTHSPDNAICTIECEGYHDVSRREFDLVQEEDGPGLDADPPEPCES
ncbi:hypothetical protein [Streptomyces sp. NPDC058653]|uniref:hypothetical protein n=1 Tax=Streptomyces sp. NPDC058653 TaxID=3346576 RepID=UPI003653F4EE